MKNQNYYAKRQAELREEAIDWQREVSERATSYGELAEAYSYFETMGRRYGLLSEFRAEGIL